MPLAVVESPRLYRQIADQLRHLIERREFPIGTRLPAERELAEKLGVSRPSVREALIALEVEGRVRIRMGSGVYVVEPPRRMAAVRDAAEAPEGPFEVLGAREVLESAICADAAGRAEPGRLVQLDDILRGMDQPGLASDELIALDRAFHVAIAELLGNGVLARLVGTLFDQRINPYFRRLASHFENEASWREALLEHRAIRDALASGQAEDARAAMRHHIRQSQERFSLSFGDTFPPTGQAGVDAGPQMKN